MTSDPYPPIDCGLYDRLEAAIVQRRPVELVICEDGAEQTLSGRLKDTKTENGAEFLRLDDDRWVRMDRIVSLDGTASRGSCAAPPLLG